MIIRELPATAGIRSIHLRINAHSRGFESPFTRQGGFSRLEGERFLADVEITPSTHADADALSAMLHSLDGKTGAVALSDTARLVPKGSAAGGHVGAQGNYADGTDFTDGTKFRDGSDFGQLAAATARGDDTIHIMGLVASTTAVLKVGDLFQLGNIHEFSQLFEVMSQCNSDANGETRVAVRPRVRKAIPAGTIITFRNAKGLFRLATDTPGTPRRVPAIAQAMPIQFIEIMNNV